MDVFTTNVDGRGTVALDHAHAHDIDGVAVQYFRVQQPRRLYYSPELARALEERIAEFDILHLHSTFLYPTLTAARCATRKQVPYIVAPRGMLVKELIKRKNSFLKNTWIALFERRTIEQAAAVHVTSRLEALEIEKFGFSLPPCFEIPNGFEMPDIEPNAKRHSNVVLFLGRLDWKKGIERLISAIASLEGVILMVAGNDEVGYTPKLQALSERLGVCARVEFLGPVSGAEKWRLYRRATVFVLPSHSENFANSVLEAMAMECPVVVTPEVGLAEIVERHDAGMVSSGDPASLAATIGAVVDNPERASVMGRNGRKVVEEQYGWDDMAAATEDAYRAILEEKRKRAFA